MQKYLFFISFVLFIACGRGAQEVHFSPEQIASLHLDATTALRTETNSMIRVDLNPFLGEQRFDFGSLVEEIKIVPLETSTVESLVANIYKIVVTDAHIYIMDTFRGKGLIIFDREGNFVRRLSHGQGPGELFRLFHFAYDFENNELVLYQDRFLMYYTPDGQFIRQRELPFAFYNFLVTPNGYIFKALDRQGNNHLGHLENYRLFVTDKDFKMVSMGMYYPPQGRTLGWYDYLYKNSGNIAITQAFSDTIYQFVSETNTLRARYLLDFSSRKLPARHLHYNSFEQFQRVITRNNYYFFNGRYLETETHNVFFLDNFNRGRTIVYRDRRSGNLIGGKGGSFNLTEIPPIVFPISTFENWFISSFWPGNGEYEPFRTQSTIISEEDKLKLQQLEEEDNPVLVFFRLKNF